MQRSGRSGHGISPHVTLVLPAELLESVRTAAVASGLTLSDYLRRLIYRGMDAAAREPARRERP
jgi:hypothetical protein